MDVRAVRPGGRGTRRLRRELEPLVDDMWIDDAGNLIGHIAATPSAGDDPSPMTTDTV